MKANEFDKALRQTYEQGSFDYQPAQWDNLAQQLDEAESKKKSLAWLPFISYAASVLFMVSIGAFLMHKDALQDRIAAKQTFSEGGMTFTQPHVKQELAWQNNVDNSKGKTVTQSIINKKAAAPVQEPVLQAQNPVLAVAMPQDDVYQLSASITDVQAPQPQVTRKAPKYIDFNNYAYEPDREERTTKTIISVTGGVNYGAANSGYAMGFTAHQKLGSNVFIEGDIAFVNNMSGKKNSYIPEGTPSTITTTSTTAGTLGGAANANNATGGKSSGVGAKPSNNSLTKDDAMPVTTTTMVQGNHYNMFYAQVTPTIGYNVFKNMSLSGGADVQRLLQGDKLMTITENAEDAKHLPSYDLGFVGKTEYAITKQVKATVYYRHGLNNAVSGTDKYIDRNYVQIQLKFSILNK